MYQFLQKIPQFQTSIILQITHRSLCASPLVKIRTETLPRNIPFSRIKEIKGNPAVPRFPFPRIKERKRKPCRGISLFAHQKEKIKPCRVSSSPFSKCQSKTLIILRYSHPYFPKGRKFNPAYYSYPSNEKK